MTLSLKKLRLGLAATGVIMILLMLVITRNAFAERALATSSDSDDVTLVTDPYKADIPLYLDLNADGVNGSDEFIGTLDIYNWNNSITFSWAKHPVEDEYVGTASYRISLRQYPLGVTVDDIGSSEYTELYGIHHWASNPNGRYYVVGPFDESICFGCVTVLAIEPETFVHAYDESVDSYTYTYTPYAAAASYGAANMTEGEMTSGEFAFEKVTRTVPKPEGKNGGGGSLPQCLDGSAGNPAYQTVCHGNDYYYCGCEGNNVVFDFSVDPTTNQVAWIATRNDYCSTEGKANAATVINGKVYCGCK